MLGLGLMGGAALSALLDAGVDALGFDPIAAGSDRGSSHGSCRIFRRFNFENPNYTRLSDEAHAGWIRLQTESGQTVLTETPILEAGRPGSAMVASSRTAATRCAASRDPTGGRLVRTRPPRHRGFPSFPDLHSGPRS
ncbi:hypothetical protein [Bradyrhizobium guangdongense]